jgi:hypothetical protein
MLDASFSSFSKVVLTLTMFIINTVLPAYTIKAITTSSCIITTRIRLITNAPSLLTL